MQCRQCNKPLQREDRVVCISGSIMGDEHTDSYFLCPACRVYTVATDWDNFTGVETTSVAGPLPKMEGDARVALIRQCSQPWDKNCRCAAHHAYFNNTLD